MSTYLGSLQYVQHRYPQWGHKAWTRLDVLDVQGSTWYLCVDGLAWEPLLGDMHADWLEDWIHPRTENNKQFYINIFKAVLFNLHHPQAANCQLSFLTGHK